MLGFQALCIATETGGLLHHLFTFTTFCSQKIRKIPIVFLCFSALAASESISGLCSGIRQIVEVIFLLHFPSYYYGHSLNGTLSYSSSDFPLEELQVTILVPMKFYSNYPLFSFFIQKNTRSLYKPDI